VLALVEPVLKKNLRGSRTIVQWSDMVAGQGGGLLGSELARQLAQTGDTYHGKADLKDSVIYALMGMILVAILLGIILLTF